MQKRYRFFLSFLICFCIALILFSLRDTGFIRGVRTGGEYVISPLQRFGYAVMVGFPWIGQKEREATEAKERNIQKQIVADQTIQRDNQALKDQFETGKKYEMPLLPARVIGAPRFVPGVTVPETLILDKGARDTLLIGQGVVSGDQVVGKVSRVSTSFAVVTLVTNTSFSLPVKTARTGALGVIKGGGNGEMLLDNVLLSEEIKKDDVVVTYGDINEKGIGLPPDIIIGTIVSVDKKPSALFQTAKVQTALTFGKLPLVFVLLEGE